jgi:isoquinoline 1-oxidoreductase subunit beta
MTQATMAATGVSRRIFLKTGAAATGGLLLGFHLPAGGRVAEAAPSDEAKAVNAWLRIAPDDSVTIMVAHSEMGQGVYTALPMLVAEELEVDWSKVRAEMAPADPVFKNRMFGAQGTGGSTSIRESYEPLRRVGAEARERLRAAAAQRWGVPVADCTAREGRILHSATSRSLRYGELAESAAELEPPTDIVLKAPKDFSLIGKPLPRLDTPLKVNGAAIFGIDVKLPGMVIGSVMACPSFGGKLKAVDEKPALAIAGVSKVVKLDNAVIVLADGYWNAHKGLAALKPEWDPGPLAGASSASLGEDFRRALDDPAAVAAAHRGDTAQALSQAAKRVEALYEAPYLAHATMEPMNATVSIGDDGVDVWAPTQFQGFVQLALGKILETTPDKVRVHTTFLGGGFGRRSETDFVIYAALAAKAAGRPVKLLWSREEDMQHDFYRPASLVRFRAGLDQSGVPVALEARLVVQSILSRVFPNSVKGGLDRTAVEGIVDQNYAIANLAVDYVMRKDGAPVGFWRSVGHSQNIFFMESFIDELAHEAGQDPLAFRRALLADKLRHRAVLDKLAELGNWGKPAQPGRFQGVALAEGYDSIAAQIAEISIADGKKLTLHKVTCVVDPGQVVNPDTLEAQVESAIVYGLTAAYFGEITLKDGRVEQANFDSYPMLTLAQMPAIEVHVIASGAKIGGMGEIATPPIAPALANAIFAATGKRIRSLPLAKAGIAPA